MKTLKTRKPRSFLSFSCNRFPLQSLANLNSLLHRFQSFKIFNKPLIFPLISGLCSSILKPSFHTCPLAWSWMIFSSLHLHFCLILTSVLTTTSFPSSADQSCLVFVEPPSQLLPVLPVQGSLACWMLSPLTMWGRSGTSFSRGVASRGGGCSAIISWDHSWTPAHFSHLLQEKTRIRSDPALPSLNHSLFVWQTQLCQLRIFPVHPYSLILSCFSLLTPFR